MTTSVKHTTTTVTQTYGFEKFNWSQVIVSAGSAGPPTVQLTTDATNPPCAAEIASITRTSAGIYVVTMYDAYYAVAFARAEIDDTAGLGLQATIGNWTNLQTATPATFTIYCWAAGGGSNVDPAATTAIRLSVIFKKSFTGAAA